jgi:hypothetical protein
MAASFDAQARGLCTLLFVATVLVASRSARAQPATGPSASTDAGAGVGIVEGRVTAEAGPRPHLSFRLVQLGGDVELAVATDADGRFRIEQVPAGTYVVDIGDDLFPAIEPVVQVVAGTVTTVDFDPWPAAVAGGERICYSNAECAGWQVCSVSLGECGGASAPLAVCTGTCVAGWVAAAVRVHAVAIRDDRVDGNASVGLELVPWPLGGHLALAADYWRGGDWRLGAALRHDVGAGWSAGLRGDAVHTDGDWRPAAAARLEWSPIGPFQRCAACGFVSVLAEAGALGLDDRTLLVTLGIAVWLRRPP